MQSPRLKYPGAFNLLDGKGFVYLKDRMGESEMDIVDMARMSFMDEADNHTHAENVGLLRYLMRGRHTSPFEGIVFKFHVKCPIFIARQWLRHRTAAVNEQSARYCQMTDEFYVPTQFFEQSDSNKQGSGGPVDEDTNKYLQGRFEKMNADAFALYLESIEGFGVSKEDARIQLNVGLYTQFYWVINLHNLLHFLNLRTDPHAQHQFRKYACAIEDTLRPMYPETFRAFEDYIKESVTFSRQEVQALIQLVKGSPGINPAKILAQLKKSQSDREMGNFIKTLHLEERV